MIINDGIRIRSKISAAKALQLYGDISSKNQKLKETLKSIIHRTNL
jgi:hypothetical protein